jgi:hypothetical protein
MKSKAPAYGTSIINHNIRTELGLTLDEYAVMDSLLSIYHKQPICFTQHLSDSLGIEPDYIIESLQKKKLLTVSNDLLSIFIIAPDWLLRFDNDADFNEFFSIFHSYGNRVDSKERYGIVRKFVDRETLHTKAKQYIEWAINSYNGDWKYINACQVWLDPKKKRWENVLTPEKNSGVKESKYGYL